MSFARVTAVPKGAAWSEGAGAVAGHVAYLGTDVDYNEAWDLQRRLVADRAEGRAPDTLLLLEHAAVYTAGPRAPMEHVVGELPAPLVRTDRGGQITYHGHGQLVGYPIVDLVARGLGAKAYVRTLETALIEALANFGIAAHTEDGLTGVWTDAGKVAAIGVKISRGIAHHGFALNVNTDLSAYAPIVPCGIFDRPVTSMAHLLGAPQDMGLLREGVTVTLGRVLGVAWKPVSDLSKPASIFVER